jgi:hypothetical protein
LLNNEVAIPFGAFARDHEPEIDVIADEIDGTIVTAEPARPAVTMGTPPLDSNVGRVVIAVAAADAGSPPVADQLVDQLLDRLADLAGPAAGRFQSGHEHHDPADLVYWAEVDAARGRLATALDIVVCTHHLGGPQRTYVVTIEGPEHRLGGLVSAASTVRGASRTVLLTPAGPITAESAGSVVTLAAARHAHRLAGRVEVFPGQEWLTDDLPVADVLERTAVDEVRSTQGPFGPAAVLRAYGYVRPSYDEGALVLRVGHDDPLVVTPWELRYCRPCCGLDH